MLIPLVIYPDGNKNEFPDRPLRKLQIEIFLEDTKKDQVIAALPTAIKNIEEKLDKKMPTVFLYSDKTRGNDPDKLLFKPERPVDGLDRIAAEEVLETEERLEKRK